MTKDQGVVSDIVFHASLKKCTLSESKLLRPSY